MKLILDCCNNHLGNRYIIEQMIGHARDYAEYIKFQLYDSLKLSKSFPGYDQKVLDYYNFELSTIDIEFIFDKCKQKGIKPMFTIFCESRIDYLIPYKFEDFAIKIASPDSMKFEFMSKIYNEYPDKLMLISTGMSTEKEVLEAKLKFKEAKFLYCVSRYPTYVEDVNLTELLQFDGFSDHSLGFELSKAIGYSIPDLEFYEKHYTLSKFLPGKDHFLSVEPKDLGRLKTNLEIQNIISDYKGRFCQK